MKTLHKMILTALLCCAACGEEFAPECSSDAQCPLGACALERGVCTYAVGSCAANADCASGQSCVGATAEARGACMFPEGSCAADTDCGTMQRCEGASADARGTCVAISCSTQPDPDTFCAAARPRATCNLNTGACIPPELECLDNGECGADELCLGNACTSADCTTKDDPDGFCKDVTCAGDLGGFCREVTARNIICLNTTKRCGPRPPRTHLLIQDRSAGTACTEQSNGLGSAGVDITEALLLDDTGIIGAGVVQEYNQGSGPNDLTKTDIFKGSLIPTTSDGCVRQISPRTVVSLGCGGSIAFRFINGAGAPVLLTETQRIFIGEDGPLCVDNGDLEARVDRYEVSLCDDATGVLRCDSPITGGRLLNRSETISLDGR